MIRYILLKEFQEIIKDYRFTLIILIIIIFSIISGIINSRNYDKLNNEYSFHITQYNSKLNDCATLEKVAYLDHIALKKITQSIFLTGNYTYNFPNFSRILIPNFYFKEDILSYFPQKNIQEKISVSNFIRFDLVFFVEIVMSFLFLFIAYNGISSEKENGTLKLILSNPIYKHYVLFSKILAYLIIILFTLIFLICLQLVVIVVLGKIPLTYIIVFEKIPVFLFFSFIYLLFWVILGLLLSTIAKKSSLSLSYLLVIWVVFAIIIPFSGGFFINNLNNKLPSFYEIANKYKDLEEEMWKECNSKNASWRGGNLEYNSKDNHIKEKNFHPIYLNYLDKFNKYQYSISKKQVDQLKFLYDYSSISPVFLYRRLCESFLGEGYESNYRFLESLQLFRNNLKNSIIELDLMDKKSSHLTFLPNYMSQKPVDNSKLPRFNEIKYNTSKVLQNNWKLILLFVSEVFILLLISYFAFIRFDPR